VAHPLPRRQGGACHTMNTATAFGRLRAAAQVGGACLVCLQPGLILGGLPRCSRLDGCCTQGQRLCCRRTLLQLLASCLPRRQAALQHAHTAGGASQRRQGTHAGGEGGRGWGGGGVTSWAVHASIIEQVHPTRLDWPAAHQLHLPAAPTCGVQRRGRSTRHAGWQRCPSHRTARRWRRRSRPAHPSRHQTAALQAGRSAQHGMPGAEGSGVGRVYGAAGGKLKLRLPACLQSPQRGEGGTPGSRLPRQLPRSRRRHLWAACGAGLCRAGTRRRCRRTPRPGCAPLCTRRRHCGLQAAAAVGVSPMRGSTVQARSASASPSSCLHSCQQCSVWGLAVTSGAGAPMGGRYQLQSNTFTAGSPSLQGGAGAAVQPCSYDARPSGHSRCRQATLQQQLQVVLLVSALCCQKKPCALCCPHLSASHWGHTRVGVFAGAAMACARGRVQRRLGGAAATVE